MIDASTNIVGISNLINNDKSNSYDPEHVEQQFVNKDDLTETNSIDPKKEMKKILKNLSSKKKSHDSESNEDSESSENSIEKLKSKSSSKQSSQSESSQSSEEDENEILTNTPPKKREKKSSYKVFSKPKKKEEPSLDTFTKSYINSNILEKEHEEDTKTILLNDIDELRGELEADGVDLSRIINVDQNSSLDDIQMVYKILRHKYDKRRYHQFGEEMILSMCYGLEFLFNGERKWGPYSPDLTNWSNTVRTKLNKMRYETSTIVSNVMNHYNIGPVTRILLELVPSAILHSNLRKQQYGKTNYTPGYMSKAIGDLRQFE